MADYFDVIRLSDEDFHRLTAGVEEVFADNRAALVSDSRYPLRWLTILDAGDAFSDAEWEQFSELITNLDYLLLLGLGGASPSVVVSWAQQFDPSLVETALQRVQSVREAMPSLASAWDAKIRSVIPTLNIPDYEIGRAYDPDQPYVDLMLTGSLSGVTGQVDQPSTQRLLVRLLPSDVAYLRDLLDDVLDELQDVTDFPADEPSQESLEYEK